KLARQGALDTGSVNLGGTGPDGLAPASDFIYTNSFKSIRYQMQVCADLGVGASIAVYGPGFLQVVLAYARQGALPASQLVVLYWGVWVPSGGSPPTMEVPNLFLAMPGDTPIEWAVAVLGGAVPHTPIPRAALERGGHLRVGIEDWDTGPPNVEQVEAAVALC